MNQPYRPTVAILEKLKRVISCLFFRQLFLISVRQRFIYFRSAQIWRRVGYKVVTQATVLGAHVKEALHKGLSRVLRLDRRFLRPVIFPSLIYLGLLSAAPQLSALNHKQGLIIVEGSNDSSAEPYDIYDPMKEPIDTAAYGSVAPQFRLDDHSGYGALLPGQTIVFSGVMGYRGTQGRENIHDGVIMAISRTANTDMSSYPYYPYSAWTRIDDFYSTEYALAIKYLPFIDSGSGALHIREGYAQHTIPLKLDELMDSSTFDDLDSHKRKIFWEMELTLPDTWSNSPLNEQAASQTEHKYNYRFSVDANGDAIIDYVHEGDFQSYLTGGIGIGFAVQQGDKASSTPPAKAFAKSNWRLVTAPLEEVESDLYPDKINHYKGDIAVEMNNNNDFTHPPMGGLIVDGYDPYQFTTDKAAYGSRNPQVRLDSNSGYGALTNNKVITLCGTMELEGTEHRHNDSDALIMAIPSGGDISYADNFPDIGPNGIEGYGLGVYYSPYGNDGAGLLKVKDLEGTQEISVPVAGSPKILWSLQLILPENFLKPENILPEQIDWHLHYKKYGYVLKLDTNLDDTFDITKSGHFTRISAADPPVIDVAFAVEQGREADCYPPVLVKARAVNNWQLATAAPGMIDLMTEKVVLPDLRGVTKGKTVVEYDQAEDPGKSFDAYNPITEAVADAKFGAKEPSVAITRKDVSGNSLNGHRHCFITGRMSLSGVSERANETDGVILAISAGYDTASESYGWGIGVDDFDSPNFALAVKYNPYVNSGLGCLQLRNNNGYYDPDMIFRGPRVGLPLTESIVWQLYLTLPDDWETNESLAEQEASGKGYQYKYTFSADMDLDGTFDHFDQGTFTSTLREGIGINCFVQQGSSAEGTPVVPARAVNNWIIITENRTMDSVQEILYSDSWSEVLGSELSGEITVREPGTKEQWLEAAVPYACNGAVEPQFQLTGETSGVGALSPGDQVILSGTMELDGTYKRTNSEDAAVMAVTREFYPDSNSFNWGDPDNLFGDNHALMIKYKPYETLYYDKGSRLQIVEDNHNVIDVPLAGLGNHLGLSEKLVWQLSLYMPDSWSTDPLFVQGNQGTQYRYTYALSVDVNFDGTVDYKRTGFFHAKVCEGIGLGFGVEQGPIVNYRPVGARATNKITKQQTAK